MNTSRNKKGQRNSHGFVHPRQVFGVGIMHKLNSKYVANKKTNLQYGVTLVTPLQNAFPGTHASSGQRGAVWALISCPIYPL